MGTIWKTMYLHLFNRVTDALGMLEAGREKEAEALLKKAQNDCEELYLENSSDRGGRALRRRDRTPDN